MDAAADLAARAMHDARTLGVADSRRRRAACLRVASAAAHLLKGVIGRDQPVVELWSGRDEAHDKNIGETHCRCNGEVLFATVSVIVSDEGNDALGAATYTAYCSLLDALQVTGYPHLLRIWNSIPGINVDDGGLERYRRFNLHRYKAYVESKRPTEAASGSMRARQLWRAAGRYCLASKNRHSRSRTRARPVRTATHNKLRPAPAEFFRAPRCGRLRHLIRLLVCLRHRSIVGHQTMHPAMSWRRARTLTNLQSVVAAAISHGARDIALLSDLKLKAYVRRATRTNRTLVRQVLAGHGLDADAVQYCMPTMPCRICW